MRKIMFSDKFGLTQAVLAGRKTMTRRVISQIQDNDHVGVWPAPYVTIVRDGHKKDIFPTYQVGEEVAVAQKYYDLRNCDAFYECMHKDDPYMPLECIKDEKGAYNKMFAKAAWMPNRIRITDIKVERLQDISDEDVLKEGFSLEYVNNGWGNAAYHREAMLLYEDDWGRTKEMRSEYPKEAFSFLIDAVSGRGTWESNPWVFVYEFELVR